MLRLTKEVVEERERDFMKIKEVENRVGMTRANIRYYEQEGLLKPTFRNENNYREYSEEDVEQLQRIKILRLLGVSPADIKLLNGNAISMEELMKKRLKELEKEAKEIQDIHRICETIIDKKIDVHSLNEDILTGDQMAWMIRVEELLNKDIVEEIIVKKQLNATMAGMLSWGYILSTIVSVCLLASGNMIKTLGIGNSIDADPVGFWVMGAVLVISFFAIHYTANVIAHVIAFHTSACLLAPMAFGAVTLISGEAKAGTLKETALVMPAIGFGIMIVGYIILLYILSEKWDKMFTKIKYALLVAAIYTAVFALIIVLTFEEWIFAVITLAYFIFMIGAKWTAAVSERKTYNRYYAVRHAGSAVNIVGLNVWSVGYDSKS